MRRHAVSVLALVLAVATTGVSAAKREPTVLWRASPPGERMLPTSQALLLEDVVFFNVRDSSNAYTCAKNHSKPNSAVLCERAAVGTFDNAPVRTSGLTYYPVGSAFSWSTSTTSNSATLGSTVVFFTAGTAVCPNLCARSYAVSGESVTSLGPLPNSFVGMRYARRNVTGSPGKVQDTVAIRSIADPSFMEIFTDTHVTQWMPTAPPPRASNVIAMEGTLAFLRQNETSVELVGKNETGGPIFDLPNPCGFNSAHGWVQIAKVAYVTADNGEVLELLMVFGRNATVTDGTIFCRVSHHRGTPEWSQPVVIPNIYRVDHIEGGNGHVVVTGTSRDESKEYVGLIAVQETSAAFVWSALRNGTGHSGSGAAIGGAAVWYESGASLVSRLTYQDTAEVRSHRPCWRTPVLTRSRVYCLTSRDELTAFSPMTNSIMWSQKVEWSFGPQLVPNTDSAVAVVTTSGEVQGIEAMEVIPPGPDDEGDSGAVAAAVIFSLLFVALACGGAYLYFVKFRRREYTSAAPQRTAINEHDVTATPKAGGHDLYGTDTA